MAEEKIEIKPEEKKEDLITRVSQVKEPPKEESKFNMNELDTAIESISDPKVKEQVLGLKKSLLSGENQKYQELARLRKEYEQKLNESSNWTPERVQSLLKDSTFVKAAQDIIEPMKDDGSLLSDAEKARIKKLDEEITTLKQQSARNSRLQQDEVLKGKYANYNPEAVDIITADLLAGKVQATREHLHKVLDYDDAVKRAYELGRQDKKLETGEKIGSMSVEGVTVTGNEAPPEKEKGESDNAYFKRLGLRNIQKFQQQKK